MNISLGGREFCVPHDLLNDTWGYVPKGKSGGGGVAAGVWRKVSDTGTQHSRMVFIIKFILIHTDYIPMR